MPHPQSKNGFTLLEMSIVILIISLLVGAVVGGKHLMESSALRSVLKDKERYIAAMNQFYSKYNYLPGDFPNATKYWPAKAVCPPTSASPGLPSATCDGNGDKILADLAIFAWEVFPFWQHLQLEGLIEGIYTGAMGSDICGDQTIPSFNTPVTSIEGASFTPLTLSPTLLPAIGYYPDPNGYGTALLFGKPFQKLSWTWSSAVSTKDAQTMDSKADDGMPATGTIRAPKPNYVYKEIIVLPVTYEPDCTVLAAPEHLSTYNTAVDNAQCPLVFLTGFK